MSEKIESLKLIVKNDRRVWAAAGFLLFCLLLVSLSSTGKKSKKTQRVVINNPNDDNITEGDNGTFKDLLFVLSNNVKQIQEDNQRFEEDLDRTKKEREATQTRFSGIFEGILDKMESISDEIGDLRKDNIETREMINNIKKGPDAPQTSFKNEKVEGFGFDVNDLPPPPPEAPKGPIKFAHITSGDNVQLQLLTGVAAPVDGTPYPVMFKIVGPIVGPDGSLLDVGEARIIAAAEGLEGNSRVIFRLSELAIRHNDGRRSVIDIDGWIIGEDGVRGMPGQLKDNLGETMVALSAIASTQVLGDRISKDARRNSRSDDSDFLLVGAGQNALSASDVQASLVLGVTDTFKNMTKIIIDRFEKQVPVVEVLPGRTVQAVFSSNSEVEMLDEDADESIYGDSSLS